MTNAYNNRKKLTNDGYAYFDRWDICEAWKLLAHDWGLYVTQTRLDYGLKYRHRHMITYEGLSRNGKAIYDDASVWFEIDHTRCDLYTYNDVVYYKVADGKRLLS